jgi:hypothetical protein
MRILQTIIVQVLDAYTHLLNECPWLVAYIVATTVSLTAMILVAIGLTWLQH